VVCLADDPAGDGEPDEGDPVRVCGVGDHVDRAGRDDRPAERVVDPGGGAGPAGAAGGESGERDDRDGEDGEKPVGGAHG
jgi:hypothetical protein